MAAARATPEAGVGSRKSSGGSIGRPGHPDGMAGGRCVRSIRVGGFSPWPEVPGRGGSTACPETPGNASGGPIGFVRLAVTRPTPAEVATPVVFKPEIPSPGSIRINELGASK